jgi:hypothetical protein
VRISVFPAALAAVVVGGAAIGWLAAGPPGDPRPAAPRSAPAPPAPDPSAVAEGRQHLRQAVLSAASVLRANPCNGQAKANFLSAAQAYMAAYAHDASQSVQTPPEWRTTGDDQVRAALRDLPDEGVVDGAELARVVTAAQGQRGPERDDVLDLPPAPTAACLSYRASLGN